mmetsp:Transcript_59801/g.142382  ORF Transcript_59801/g.142382 Transcript_59801/m.142382 type:complete len:229 (-) Transcript_59801:16-702(-)
MDLKMPCAMCILPEGSKPSYSTKSGFFSSRRRSSGSVWHSSPTDLTKSNFQSTSTFSSSKTSTTSCAAQHDTFEEANLSPPSFEGSCPAKPEIVCPPMPLPRRVLPRLRSLVALAVTLLAQRLEKVRLEDDAPRIAKAATSAPPEGRSGCTSASRGSWAVLESGLPAAGAEGPAVVRDVTTGRATDDICRPCAPPHTPMTSEPHNPMRHTAARAPLRAGSCSFSRLST